MDDTRSAVRHVFDELANGTWEELSSRPVDCVSYTLVTRRRAVEELLTPHVWSGTRAVDVGCGTGELVPFYVRAGARYVGIDFSSEMIKRARAKFAPDVSKGRADFIEGDSEVLPVGDEEADVVSSVAVIEYLPRPGRSLDEIARVLRPGGVAVISVPNKSGLNFKARRVAEPAVRLLLPLYLKLRGGSRRHVVTMHIRHEHYDPEELDGMMRERGFAKLEGRFANFTVILYPVDHFMPKTYMRISEFVERTGRQVVFRRFASNYIGLYEKAS